MFWFLFVVLLLFMWLLVVWFIVAVLIWSCVLLLFIFSYVGYVDFTLFCSGLVVLFGLFWFWLFWTMGLLGHLFSCGFSFNFIMMVVCSLLWFIVCFGFKFVWLNWCFRNFVFCCLFCLEVLLICFDLIRFFCFYGFVLVELYGWYFYVGLFRVVLCGYGWVRF